VRRKLVDELGVEQWGLPIGGPVGDERVGSPMVTGSLAGKVCFSASSSCCSSSARVGF
jgi:hypothetical protein